MSELVPKGSNESVVETIALISSKKMSEVIPIKKKPVSVVNKVTEYGALFNSLNDKRVALGLPALTTAMEVLIEAIQPESDLDIKERAKIADSDVKRKAKK